MQADLFAILEKSVGDLLQYKKNGTIQEVLRTVMGKHCLRQNKKGLWDMQKETERIKLREINETDTGNQVYLYEREMKGWFKKPLEDKYYAIYIDVLRIAVRRDTMAKEAFYIVPELRPDLRRKINRNI